MIWSYTAKIIIVIFLLPHCNTIMKQTNGNADLSKELFEIQLQLSGLPRE